MKNKVIPFFLMFFTLTSFAGFSAENDGSTAESDVQNPLEEEAAEAVISGNEVLIAGEENSDQEKISQQEESLSEEVADEEVSEEASEIEENDDKALWWQGKVSVAEENQLPQGIFAAAKGYFPGDTLSVTNNKTMKSLEVLVIGNLDQTDQTAIIFSKEAADALKISESMEIMAYLDSRSSNLEKHEFGGAKLSILSDEDAYGELEQPVSTEEDEKILSVSEESLLAENDSKNEFDNESTEIEDISPVEESSENELSEAEVPAENTESASYDAILLTIPEELSQKENEVPEEPAPSSDIDSKSEAEKEITATLIPLEEAEKKAEVEVKENENKPEEAAKKVEIKKENISYKNLIAGEQMVRKGYYVQIAFLTSEKNLQSFVDKYHGDLKLFLIPHNNGFKVFAGLFGDDDKDFALDYIKSLGFKDAFIRKLGR